ncbi:MAG: hypothetical protein HY329_26365 [Chloroflexi bacterium]|nr:hypothetical protein [Chloroflexota bacterium]
MITATLSKHRNGGYVVRYYLDEQLINESSEYATPDDAKSAHENLIWQEPSSTVDPDIAAYAQHGGEQMGLPPYQPQTLTHPTTVYRLTGDPVTPLVPVQLPVGTVITGIGLPLDGHQEITFEGADRRSRYVVNGYGIVRNFVMGD